MALPKVHVVATGGTIGFVGRHRLDLVEYGAFGKPILIPALLARIPESRDVARVTGEQMYVEDYRTLAMGPEQWLPLARRCNELLAADRTLAGIVVTHGTNTLEETAYFLHLTVKDRRPVVVTGAQRPSSGISSDADANLLDAIRVAASRDSRDKGVVTVFNNEISSVRDMTKTNTYRLETFQTRDLGFLGYCDNDGQVVYYRAPTRKHTHQTEFDPAAIERLPQVDIAYAYGGVDGRVIEALVARKADGIVVAGVGAGGMPPAMAKAAEAAVKKGVAVVLSSRTGSGRVVPTTRGREQGFTAGDNLTPQKARVLLMLGLTRTRDAHELQRMFGTY